MGSRGGSAGVFSSLAGSIVREHPHFALRGCRRSAISTIAAGVGLKEEAKDSLSVVGLALRRPYTFIVMAMLIVLATPFVLARMAMDIFPEIDIPVISVIWNYDGLPAQEMGQRIAGQSERGVTTKVSEIERIELTSIAGATAINI